MPIPNAKYRVTKGHVRLAFVNGQVVEAKNLKTGDVHTPKQFAADKKKRAKRKAKRGKK
jgi:hypothetical protein